MDYLDSTNRSVSSALAYRLAQETASEQAYLRIKTGYFTLNGLAGLKACIDHLVQKDLPVSIALGANEQSTIAADVDTVYSLIGSPRVNAKLCVICCAGGLFHPKVVHLTRTDGSQLAYVGSANVTPAGLNGTNIESGILLDTRSGDSTGILDQIAASIDYWFNGPIAGVTPILGPATTQDLVAAGVLGVVKPPKTGGSGSSSGGAQMLPKMTLSPLVTYPSLAPAGAATPVAGTPAASLPTSSSPAPTVGAPEILVAEIGGGPRWKQANFPYAVMQSYFGVNPTGHGNVSLVPVDGSGAPSPPVPTQVVSVASQNYRLELGAVSGIPYPSTGRPIAVFRRTTGGSFRYRVFMPGDPGHSLLEAALVTRYNGPAHHLKRVVITSSDLAAIWSACPV